GIAPLEEPDLLGFSRQLHHLVNLPAHFVTLITPIVLPQQHGHSISWVHGDANNAIDARARYHCEAEFLQHHRQRNFQHLNGKHCANAGARPRTKRHVLVLRWIDLAPPIGTENFRFRISFWQMMSEKMTANDAGTVTK